MTDIALIPPLSHIGDVLDTRTQLVLPSLWDRSVTYRNTYAETVRRGDLVILDNGAFEGTLWSTEALNKIARELRPTEIVVPDVMQSVRGTLDKVQEFQEQILPGFRYMVVAQGLDYSEFFETVRGVVEKRWVRTIGIPKHMHTTLSNGHGSSILVRHMLAAHIQRAYPGRFHIHFLGMSEFAREEMYNRDLAKGVRSIDTSLPYVYAKCSQSLATSKHVLTRTDDYFDMHPIDRGLVERNIMELLELVGD